MDRRVAFDRVYGWNRRFPMGGYQQDRLWPFDLVAKAAQEGAGGDIFEWKRGRAVGEE